MNGKGIFLLVLALVALSACATVPSGPSVRAWPAPGKPFEVFQTDETTCREWAAQQVGGELVERANQTLAGGMAVGTMIGAGLGAAFGAATGDLGAGLAIGAVSGAIVGTAASRGSHYEAQWEIQRRYDHAYLQCMYAKRNQVPGARPYRRVPPPPPPGAYPPPPPSNSR